MATQMKAEGRIAVMFRMAKTSTITALARGWDIKPDSKIHPM